MTQSGLDFSHTAGPAFDSELDRARLSKQHERIRGLLVNDSRSWWTLREIAEALGYPEASVSAQLRHLRKPRFGSYNVEKRSLGGGLWEYRINGRRAEQ